MNPHGCNTLVILTKAPDPSRSKTRLRPLGAEAVLALSEAMLVDVIEGACALSATDIFLACDPHPHLAVFEDLARRYPLSCIEQGAGDLGDRLLRLARRFDDRPLIFLGSDCPHLPTDHLKAAFLALETHDLVLCPADDGGYTLIGQNTVHGPLYENMPWSSDAVLRLTQERAQALGLSQIHLPALWDIDTPADLGKLWAERARWQAPNTLKTLEKTLSPAQLAAL